MESRFLVTTKQDKGSYRNMTTAEFALYDKTPTAVFYAITVGLAAFVWWGGVFASGRVATPLVAVVYGAVLLAIGILSAPYLDRFAVKQVSARMLRSTLKKAKDLGTELHLDFGDEGFVLETQEVRTQRAYGAISDLCETRTHLLLFQKKNACFCFAKAGVDGGDWQGLKQFLEEKCGTAFRQLDF